MIDEQSGCIASVDDRHSGEIVLINIFGVDQPGIVSTITGILSTYGAAVLDIGQAVIHQHLTLGILISLPPVNKRRALEQELCVAVEAMDNRIKFETVGHDSYADWVEQQGKPRHIVTLLARHITAEHLASVTAVAVNHGLSFDRITRLSGRIPLASLSSQTQASIEFSARGVAADLAALRANFMELAVSFDIDVAVQEDSIYRRNRRLVCFDMDSTLIEAEVIDELAKEAGVGEQVVQITEAAMAGDLDFNQSFTQRMALLQGLDESVLESVAARLKLTEGAEKLFKALRKLGYKTAILSGGFDYFAAYLQRQLDIDYVYANQLDIVDGKLTGKVAGEIVNGERKAMLLNTLAQQENISLQQVIAVGDGANDLPMLSEAGLGIAFRAKPLVKASAEQSISQMGLDAILYLMGLSDRETTAIENNH
ncbi:MAG: phosphoserine phosphatase SerB [Cellvibrionaceae bacterium]|nr:phosphoserine phosphatase SerB [Cellvibrionaceae bacterium]